VAERHDLSLSHDRRRRSIWVGQTDTDVRRLGIGEELISGMEKQLEALNAVEKKNPARAK